MSSEADLVRMGQVAADMRATAYMGLGMLDFEVVAKRGSMSPEERYYLHEQCRFLDEATRCSLIYSRDKYRARNAWHLSVNREHGKVEPWDLLWGRLFFGDQLSHAMTKISRTPQTRSEVVHILCAANDDWTLREDLEWMADTARAGWKPYLLTRWKQS